MLCNMHFCSLGVGYRQWSRVSGDKLHMVRIDQVGVGVHVCDTCSSSSSSIKFYW